MLAPTESTLTWNDWIAILARNFHLDAELLRRRDYRRYDVIDGLAFATFIIAPKGVELPRPASMTLLDVSPTGLMTRGFDPYERDTEAVLELIFADVHRFARARVMHCTSTLGGFKVGFELLFSDGRPAE